MERNGQNAFDRAQGPSAAAHSEDGPQNANSLPKGITLHINILLQIEIKCI